MNHSAQIDPTIPSQDQRFQERMKIWAYQYSKELGYWFSCKQTALYHNFMEFRCFMLLPIFESFTYCFFLFKRFAGWDQIIASRPGGCFGAEGEGGVAPSHWSLQAEMVCRKGRKTMRYVCVFGVGNVCWRLGFFMVFLSDLGW